MNLFERISLMPVLMPFMALALVSCAQPAMKNEAPGPAAANTGLVSQQARITDAAIRGDENKFNQVQQRLRKLSESGVPQGNYALAKAQCWLDTARSQHDENDRTGYVEEALTESLKITQALETDRNARAGGDTPLIARSSKLREDLWAQLGGLKSKPEGMACYASTVACAEVRLVRAGHANEQTGWRQATPHIKMVEDALGRATTLAAQCKPATLAVAPVAAATSAPIAAAAASPVAPSAAPVGGRESFVVLSDALFAFNKSGRADLLPGGVQRLTEIAARLKTYQSIASLAALGHTDRLGSADYNARLSQARADTVKAFFDSQGIKATVTSAQGVGARDPVSGTECSKRMSKAALINCLQADRRVTVEAKGTVK